MKSDNRFTAQWHPAIQNVENFFRVRRHSGGIEASDYTNFSQSDFGTTLKDSGQVSGLLHRNRQIVPDASGETSVQVLLGDYCAGMA